MKKFIEIIKKKWLRDTILTILLIAILITAFIGINFFIGKLNLLPIDFTEEKIYTLSEESKKQVKGINQEVNIYFFGYSEDTPVLNLAKQYERVNEKVKVEVINADERPDLAKQYNITSDYSAVIVQAPERYKVLTDNDFYTYDSVTYETIDITEQKITNAIIDTTISEKPGVYFLTGHNEYDINSEIASLAILIQNEVNEVNTINLLQEDLSEKCDVLVIGTPQTDFTEYETNKILSYINQGGNILWMNDPSIVDVNYPNMQKILDAYGISFSKGVIFETSNTNMLLQSPQFILPNVSYHEITKDIFQSLGIVMVSPGKLNVAAQEKLDELKVTISPFIQTGETAYYRESYSQTNASLTPNSSDTKGPFTIGAEAVKKINDNTESKLIVYTNNIFASDNRITIGNQQTTLLSRNNNKDLVLNSIAYLTDRGDTIRIRKSTDYVAYTATQQQDNIVRIVIFSVPAIIVLAGIVVWQVRRRKK